MNIDSPTDGASFTSGESISFTGTATDNEDGDVTSSLVWNSSLDGQIGTSGSFSAVLSDGTHTITATATDSAPQEGSDTITITVSIDGPPSVSITSPADGASFTSGESISFTGTATDNEDGNVAGSLVWTSDLDGQIGTSGSFSAVLSDGTHIITATATDSASQEGSDSITVTVTSDGGGGGDLVGSNDNDGRYWIAMVTDTGGDLEGSFDYGGGGTCSGDTCTLSDIPKRVSSVTFTRSSDNATVTVFKP